MQVETLDTPLLLIAMKQVVDPFFYRSVVLLLEHTPAGSFGLIINRPLDMTIDSVLGDLPFSWQGAESTAVHLGGPVQPNIGLTLFTEASLADGEKKEVAPGLHLATDMETLRRIAAAPPKQLLFLVGYSGWGEGQLDDELARNDWLIAPFSLDLIFSADPSTTWVGALESIGVRPEALPFMTGGSEN